MSVRPWGGEWRGRADSGCSRNRRSVPPYPNHRVARIKHEPEDASSRAMHGGGHRWPRARPRVKLFIGRLGRPATPGGKQYNIWSRPLAVRCLHRRNSRSRCSKEQSSRISNT